MAFVPSQLFLFDEIPLPIQPITRQRSHFSIVISWLMIITGLVRMRIRIRIQFFLYMCNRFHFLFVVSALACLGCVHSGSTLEYRSIPVACNICQGNNTLINGEKEFTMSNGLTWTCEYLQETVQDVDENGNYGEARMCRQAQLQAEWEPATVSTRTIRMTTMISMLKTTYHWHRDTQIPTMPATCALTIHPTTIATEVEFRNRNSMPSSTRGFLELRVVEDCTTPWWKEFFQQIIVSGYKGLRGPFVAKLR